MDWHPARGFVVYACVDVPGIAITLPMNSQPEVIAACIRETASDQLQTLKWLLAQQELERPDLDIPAVIH